MKWTVHPTEAMVALGRMNSIVLEEDVKIFVSEGVLKSDKGTIIVYRDDEMEYVDAAKAVAARMGLMMGDRFFPFPGVYVQLFSDWCDS